MKKITEGEKRILVAEKDSEVRHLLSESLRLQGYEVQEIERPGKIDLRRIPKAPDLFLLGHGFSEAEAFDALEAVRASKKLGGVPVIVIAVDPDEGFLMRAIARGADSLLPFPFRMETLQEKVETLLSGNRTSLMPAP